MYTKVNNSLNSFRNFLTNTSIPIGFKKKKIIQSYIISKPVYYSPLLGSNIDRTKRTQSLVHKAIHWSINSATNNKKKSGSPYLSTYALTRDFRIPPLSGICAAQQIKCFIKWRSSNCIIRDLVRNIPTMSHYSWAKESRILRNKLLKRNLNNTKEVKEYYWLNSSLNKGKKALEYTNNKFSDTSRIFVLGYEHPHLNLGINWILRIRCGFENNSKIAIASNRVNNECPNFCPCCETGSQSFQHWILECTRFNQLRSKYLYFINDLFNIFLEKFNTICNRTIMSDIDINGKINKYIYLFLLGGTLAFNELQIDRGERRLLNERLNGSSESTIPYIVGFAEFLTKSIPLISSSMELLFERFSKTPIVIKSVDVVPIRQRNNSIPYTGSNIEHIDINSWESLVDTTLSSMMLLLYFRFFEFLGRGDSRKVHLAKIYESICHVLNSYINILHFNLFIIVFFMYFYFIFFMYYKPNVLQFKK